VVGRYVASGVRPKGDHFGWPLLEEGNFDSAFKKTSLMMSEACAHSSHAVLNKSEIFELLKKEGITVSLLAIFCVEGINIPCIRSG